MHRTVLLLLVFCFVADGFACTSAVISGRITPDGRPLLWKNRDTDYLENSVKFFKGTKYSFIGIVNNGMKHKKEVWIGTNSAGFSIMNTQSYNLIKNVKDGDDPGPSNGSILYKALGVCATVADFRHFLDTISKPSGIEANIGVIDAQGGAAMFEVSYYKYVFYDANNLVDAPNGYIARTNFSFSGDKNEGAGYVRYATEDKALLPASTSKEITPHWIFSNLSRSFINSQLGIDLRNGNFNVPASSGWFVDQDFIPRNITSCSVVVQGVKKGENPDLTVMWTVLGYPPVSIAFPIWLKEAQTLLPSLYKYPIGSKVTPFGAKVDALKEKVFGFHQGSGTNKYFNWELLYNKTNTGIIQQLDPIEEKIVENAGYYIDRWRDKNRINSNELQKLYDELSEYVIEQYHSLFGI